MTIIDRNMAEVGEITFDVRPDSEWMEATLGKEKCRIKKMDLWAFVFAIMGEKEQEALMPVRQTEVMHYTKTHTVQLMKDMKRGETLKVKCHTSVPTTVVEGLRGIIQEEVKKGATGIQLF